MKLEMPFLLMRRKKINELRSYYNTNNEELQFANKIIRLIEEKKYDQALSEITLHQGTTISNSLQALCNNVWNYEVKQEREQWISTGLVTVNNAFSSLDKNFDEKIDSALNTIVKYTNANQGGFFLHHISDEGESVLKLKACFAFSRKRIIEKEVESTSGIIGQCFQEQDVVILKEVPKNYFKITSGLGEALPGYIIVLPLSVSDLKVGVLELAYFEPLEEFEVNFLKEVCHTLSVSISEIIKSERKEKMLESAEAHKRKMLEQEEILKHHLDEMKIIQDELETKNRVLEESKAQIEEQKQQILRLREEDALLLESKMATQQMIHERTVAKLMSKIKEYQSLSMERSMYVSSN